MASKRKRITLEAKVAIIEAVERKTKTNAQICREFDLPSSTLYTILKGKEKIMKAHNNGDFDRDQKKLRTADFSDVDKALIIWFKQARSQQVPISGLILMEKANTHKHAHTHTHTHTHIHTHTHTHTHTPYQSCIHSCVGLTTHQFSRIKGHYRLIMNTSTASVPRLFPFVSLGKFVFLGITRTQQ